MSARISKEEKERRLAEGVRMYKEGYTQQAICSDLRIDSYLLKDALLAAGIEPAKYRRENKGSVGNVGKTALDAIKDEEKITWQKIGEVRNSLKIGDRIRILTEKSWSFEEGKSKESQAKWATIVSKGRRFCTVSLDGNHCHDTVYYDDIYNARKKGLNYVG